MSRAPSWAFGLRLALVNGEANFINKIVQNYYNFLELMSSISKIQAE